MDTENSLGIVSTQHVTFKDEFFLESGRMLSPVTIAYETYGTLNENKSNAILVCHALTGSAHAAGLSSSDNSTTGWWDPMIGPNKPIDTNKYFVVCSNILGSCYGSTGPASIDPYTGSRYALKFPVVTIRDMVKAQKKLLDYLQIEKLFCVAGGSLGGMQALEWSITYSEIVDNAIIISAAGRITPMAMAFNTVGRYAIIKDPNWQEGNYYDKTAPKDGLAIARMAGHITYLSDASFNSKFGRRLGHQDSIFDFSSSFEVENYLRYNGYKFTERFDANSYLYLLKAMDIFDLSYGYGSYAESLKRLKANSLFIDFTTDFLFPAYQMDEMCDIMKTYGNKVERVTIDSDYGHDAFLLEFDDLSAVTFSFLEKAWRKKNV